jgi:hypothetical protein
MLAPHCLPYIPTTAKVFAVVKSGKLYQDNYAKNIA